MMNRILGNETNQSLVLDPNRVQNSNHISRAVSESGISTQSNRNCDVLLGGQETVSLGIKLNRIFGAQFRPPYQPRSCGGPSFGVPLIQLESSTSESNLWR